MFSSFLDASELESVFFLKFVSFSFIYSSNDHALEHVYMKLQSLLMCKIRRQMHAVLTAAVQLWIMRCVCPKLSYDIWFEHVEGKVFRVCQRVVHTG